MASASSRRLFSSKLAQAVPCPHVPRWVACAGPLTSQPLAGGRSLCPSSLGWGRRRIPESPLACGLIPSFPEGGSAVLGQGPPLSLARPWLGPHQRVRAWPGPSGAVAMMETQKTWGPGGQQLPSRLGLTSWGPCGPVEAGMAFSQLSCSRNRQNVRPFMLLKQMKSFPEGKPPED